MATEIIGEIVARIAGCDDVHGCGKATRLTPLVGNSPVLVRQISEQFDKVTKLRDSTASQHRLSMSRLPEEATLQAAFIERKSIRTLSIVNLLRAAFRPLDPCGLHAKLLLGNC